MAFLSILSNLNMNVIFLPCLGRGFCYPVIKSCVFGSESKSGLLDEPLAASRNEPESTSSTKQALKLIFCAAGLQVSLFSDIPPYLVCDWSFFAGRIFPYRCIHSHHGVPLLLYLLCIWLSCGGRAIL